MTVHEISWSKRRVDRYITYNELLFYRYNDNSLLQRYLSHQLTLINTIA